MGAAVGATVAAGFVGAAVGATVGAVVGAVVGAAAGAFVGGNGVGVGAAAGAQAATAIVIATRETPKTCKYLLDLTINPPLEFDASCSPGRRRPGSARTWYRAGHISIMNCLLPEENRKKREDAARPKCG